MNCSIIVSTYNRIDALSLTLQSILNQSVLPNEIIVADDGSDEKTKNLVINFSNKSTIPIIHCWQEDKGFRLARIRNLALIKASFEYILQIDGDVILHPDFVKHHLFFAKKGYFSRGCRVELNEKYTKEIISFNKIPKQFNNSQFENYKLPNGTSSLIMRWLLRLLRKPSNGVLGCNMAYFLSDAKAINGFNNDFEGWGMEDDDFSTRLINSGVKMQTIKFGAILYHLWHKTADRKNYTKNQKILNEIIEKKIVKCENGISQITDI